MRRILFTLAFMVVTPMPAFAQLAGTDITLGASCAGFPAGATAMTADANQDLSAVTVICNGGTWKMALGAAGGAGRDTRPE